jgi:hypothetical protein
MVYCVERMHRAEVRLPGTSEYESHGDAPFRAT